MITQGTCDKNIYIHSCTREIYRIGIKQQDISLTFNSKSTSFLFLYHLREWTFCALCGKKRLDTVNCWRSWSKIYDTNGFISYGMQHKMFDYNFRNCFFFIFFIFWHERTRKHMFWALIDVIIDLICDLKNTKQLKEYLHYKFIIIHFNDQPSVKP